MNKKLRTIEQKIKGMLEMAEMLSKDQDTEYRFSMVDIYKAKILAYKNALSVVQDDS